MIVRNRGGTMTLAPATLYQSTDLARRHREVVETARHPGGAVIREKDGEALLLTLAAPVLRDRYVLNGFRSAIQVLHLLGTSVHREGLLYGQLAWLALLPEADQTTFIWEYVGALQAAEGTGTEPVEQLLHEWQQTARAWADEELRAELSTDLDEPLPDVEL
jgi:hypothetical protein